MDNINSIDIPEQLRQRNCWVVWRKEKRHRKFTKVPYNARTGKRASTTDPSTWCSFDEAVHAQARGRYSGLGFVFTSDDRIVGIDLDKCRDPKTGELAPWARVIISQLDCYTEVSPSGCGVHLYVLGTLPPGGRKRGLIEVYESARYFTVTGDHLAGTPLTIEERSDRLREFHESNFARDEGRPSTARARAVSLDDSTLIAKAKASKNGAKFARLFEGDCTGYASQSEADQALCMMLAYWSGRDPAQVDRIFRQSGLYRPKWDEQHYGDGRTYGAKTVQTAVDRCTDTYRVEESRPTEVQLPEISVTDRPLQEMTADALTALELSNEPPTIFVRSGALARMLVDENKRPVIDQMTESQVRHRMARSAFFLKLTRSGWQYTPPPMDVVKDVIANGTWKFPALHSIVEVPVIRPAGTVLETAGYDPATKLIYRPATNLRIPIVPPSPSPEQVKWALDMIDEAIGEFPFANPASKANAVAALLTPIVRPIISGPTPLGLIDAPKAGTGKGLLAECISLIATGRSAALMTAPDTEDEWRKRITATLLEGASVITVDNLEGKLESATLSSALTSISWKDRILGRTETVTLPQQAAWIGTGNNIRLGGDMPRRCYLIRLDAHVARPWLRNEWRHPELSRWVSEHRGELIAALLTLARSWYAEQRPEYICPRLGSFEVWSRVVGNILNHAGVEHFLANLDDLYQLNDCDEGQWAAFFEAWNRAFDDRKITVAEVMREMETNLGLREMVPDWLADGYHREPGKFKKQLGEALGRQRDAQYGPWRLERRGKDRRGVALWSVVEVDTATEKAA